MKRFMIFHTLDPGLTRENISEVSKASQQDPSVRGYRSFLSLTACKGVCIFEARDRDSLITWLKNRNLSYDEIVQVELEGEYGKMTDLLAPVGVGSG